MTQMETICKGGLKRLVLFLMDEVSSLKTK